MLNIYLIYNQYEIIFYSLQQQACNAININYDSNGFLSYLLIFLLGFITSLNPCFLSILPISLSYLNIQDLEKKNKNFFILGIFSSFIFLLLVTHIISYRYRFILSSIPILSSVIVIILGLSFLQIIDISTFYSYFFVNSSLNISFRNVFKDYLLGFFSNLTTLQCSTPIILTVLFWLSHSSSFLSSILYLFIYLIGSFISIFILITFAYNSFNRLAIFKFWNILFPFSGFIILFNGTVSLLEKIYS